MPANASFDSHAAAALWASYAGGQAAVREQLVQTYLPFARIMAARLFAARTHMQVEFDEYLQFARVGLMEAVDRYDPARGSKFETFAASRIRGAILSGMASYSEVHEQIAARKRLVGERLAALKDSGRATAEPAALFGYLAELAIGLAVGFALEDSGMYSNHEQPAHYADNSYAGVELKQLRARLKSLLEQLPGKHRQVVACHYLQRMAFEEVAERMQLSKGRVAQIHREALLKLRDALRGQPELNWSG